MPPNAELMDSGLPLSGCLPVPVPPDGAVPAIPLNQHLLASSTTTLVFLCETFATVLMLLHPE